MKKRILWLTLSLAFGLTTAFGAETTKTAATAPASTPTAKLKASSTKAKSARSPRSRKRVKPTPTPAPSAKKTNELPDIAGAGKANSSKKGAATGQGASGEGDSRAVIVKAVKISLRAKPEKTAKVLASLTQFTPVHVIGAAGAWMNVKTDDGTKGYVLAGTLARAAFVSTQGGSSKIRSGPTTKDTALFSLKDRYPLRVLEKAGRWVRVRDYEGDGGWVSERSLCLKNCVVAKEKVINLREGPGAQFPKRFVADKGFLFEVIEEKNGWLHLRCADGDEGWCSAKVVWGWLPE